MDTHIKQFIGKEKNLTSCTAIDNVPNCANCFYAFDAEINYLFFKSGRETLHIVNALKNEHVAGTIIPDIKKAGTIKGIQYVGKFIVPKDDMLEKAKNIYYLKFPFALLIPGELWAIALSSIKMTDNTMGFGKKYQWSLLPEKDLMGAL